MIRVPTYESEVVFGNALYKMATVISIYNFAAAGSRDYSSFALR